MKIIKNNHEIILKNNPYPLRFIGLFFFVISSTFVYGSLGGYSNYAQADSLVLKIHFLFGAIGVCFGSSLILTKSTCVIISELTRNVKLIKNNFFSKNEASIPFYKIKQFIISEKEDQDGDSIWKVDLELESAEIIELTSVWLHDKPQCEEASNSANLILNKPIFSASNQS